MTRITPLVALLAALVCAQSAWAGAITITSIDSPADPTYLDVDTSSHVAFHVHGTSNNGGALDLNCYDSTGTPQTLVANLDTNTDNTFDADVTNAEAANNMQFPCVLRAVATGDPATRPPSDINDPHQGPMMVASTLLSEHSTSGKLDNFDYLANGLGGSMELESASGGGLYNSQLYAPGTLAPSEALFADDGWFNGASFVVVDGAESFLPSDGSGPTPGWSALTYTKTFDPATGDVTITSHEPAVTCNVGCSSFVSTGVELDRTLATSDDGRMLTMTDRWRSTDGAAHSLDATYAQGFHTSNAGGAFLFPGKSSFQDYALHDTVALPHGPGTMYVKENAGTPDSGDTSHPQGAVGYASAPDSSAELSAKGTNYSEWDAHYIRTIPATGALVLRFSYAQSFALSDVQALAGAAAASFAPTVTIASPADGATSNSPNITVSGTASDSAGLASFKLNGQDVSVASDGSWSAPVVLSSGANRITALATDVDGITGQRQITVTYVPPSPPPQVAKTAVLKLRGRPHVHGSGVHFQVSCANAHCKGSATLFVTEIVRRHGGKVVGVASRKHARTRRKRVMVGHASISLDAGRVKTITVKLNSRGRKLLARFRRLHVTLSITSSTGAAKTAKVATRHLTIKAKRKRHHGK